MVSVKREVIGKRGSKFHVLTVRDGCRGGFSQMAGEGRLTEVRVKRRDLGWIRKVDRRREGTKTSKSGKTRRNSGVREITCWRILKGRLLLTARVLAAILWRWRRTGPEAVLKVTRRTGPSELGIAGSAILD